MPKLIFISHSASLTGAPLIVSALVNFISRHRPWKISLLFLSNDTGSSAFNLIRAQRSPHITVIHGLSKYLLFLRISISSTLRRFVAPILPAFVKYILPSDPHSTHPTIIYSNSIVSLHAAVKLKSFSKDILILHLHEMSFWINRTSQVMPNLDAALNKVDLIIAPSTHCIEALRRSAKVSLTKHIRIIPEPNNIHHGRHQSASLDANRIGYLESVIKNVKSKGYKLCICNGTDSWRKGLDHFLAVAAYLNHRFSSSYYFLWVSLPLGSIEKLQVDVECKLLGIQDVIHFGEPVSDFSCILKQSDCYLLTSREDPMPVAALEAMICGVPVVCFANTGGVPDLLSGAMNQVAPYANIKTFANSVHTLINDPVARAKAIEYQNNVVNECSSDRVFGSIMEIIDNLLSA